MLTFLVFLKRVKNFLLKHKTKFIIVAVILAAFITAKIITTAYDNYIYNKQQKKLNELDKQISNSNINTQTIKEEMKIKRDQIIKIDPKVKQKKEEIKNLNKTVNTNISFDEANRLRCEVYPEDKGCLK